MIKKVLVLIALTALTFWVAGCAKNPTGAAKPTTAPSQDFGGYTTSNEAPAFGDQDLLTAEGTEQEVTDPILSTPGTRELVNSADAGIFQLRAVWGTIPNDSTVTTTTDWSGSLTLTRGAIVLRRLIQFESGQDSILLRTSPTLLEWVSFTKTSHDGIAVNLFVPPGVPTIDSAWVRHDTDSTLTIDSSWVHNDGDSTLVIDSSWVITGFDSTLVVDTIPPEPATVTFATDPYSRTFTLPELAALDTVITLTDGNKVAFQAMQLFRETCPRGILAGMWGLDSTGAGVFKGFWMTGEGHLTGFVDGTFGKDSLGANVFFGKWIDMSGQFQGLLRGTWGRSPAAANQHNHGKRPGGWFSGTIYDAGGSSGGVLSGRFHDALKYKDGWFQARWKLNCPNMGDDDEIGDGDHNGGGDEDD